MASRGKVKAKAKKAKSKKIGGKRVAARAGRASSSGS